MTDTTAPRVTPSSISSAPAVPGAPVKSFLLERLLLPATFIGLGFFIGRLTAKSHKTSSPA
jgi:hypothetical protein